VGAQSYECTSSVQQQERSGRIGGPEGPCCSQGVRRKKQREKQVSNHTGKVKDLDDPLSGNGLHSYNNNRFFVFLAMDLGHPWGTLRIVYFTDQRLKPGWLLQENKDQDDSNNRDRDHGIDEGQNYKGNKRSRLRCHEASTPGISTFIVELERIQGQVLVTVSDLHKKVNNS
jgi:hypothetical protein